MVKTDLDAWLVSPGRLPTAQSRVALARTLRRFLTESQLTLANSSAELEHPEERATAEFRYKSAVQYLALLDYLRSKPGQGSRRYRSRLAEVERRQAGFLNLERLTAGGKGMHAESLLVNCGMSAYDALCDQLSLVPNSRERDHLRPVVFCTSAYNENEWVVRDAFGEDRIRLIRPDHTQAILRGIYHHQALAVFCEILTNNVDLLRFPLKEILDRLRGRAPSRVVHLVVDVTASGNNLALDRLLTLPPSRNVVLVLTESLQKFYQRGLEVTSGGMIHLVSAKCSVSG